jgi:hypothetical protein
VWSGFTNRAHLHLGRGWALVQIGRSQAELVRFAATLPLARQLAKIAQALSAPPAKARAHALHVTLSAALCPAVAFPVPDNVKNSKQRLEIARAVGASHIGAPVAQCACDFDAARPGVAGVVPRALIADITAWAGQTDLRLRSITPLWSKASECGAARRRSVRAVVLHEPDAVTVLSAPANRAATGASWPADGNNESLRARAQDWLRDHDLDSGEAVQLTFGTHETQGAAGLPSTFSGYWRVG